MERNWALKNWKDMDKGIREKALEGSEAPERRGQCDERLGGWQEPGAWESGVRG